MDLTPYHKDYVTPFNIGRGRKENISYSREFDVSLNIINNN